MLFAALAEHGPAPVSGQMLAFASGVNRVAEMRGFSRLRMPFGVSAAELSERALQFLLTLDMPLLVDSGAFSEVQFSDAGCHVVQPISDAEWHRRLRIYKRLGTVLKADAYVVAPDRVGDQQVTLQRLGRYKADLQELAGLGATVLIPLQVGVLSHAEFYRAANDSVGFSMVPAMPMKKGATDIDDLLTFVREVHPLNCICLA